MPSQHVLVANAHIHWDPEFADVKLIQTLMLTNELNNIVMKAQMERGIGFKTPIPGMPGVPVMMCCDLNSLLDSSVVEYLRTGRIATSHRDLQGHSYDGFLQRFSASVRGGIRVPSGKPELVHQFNLRRTYSGQMEYTNFTFDFKGVIDYIFYSAGFLTPLGLMGPVSMDWARECKVIGCSNPHFLRTISPFSVSLSFYHNTSKPHPLLSSPSHLSSDTIHPLCHIFSGHTHFYCFRVSVSFEVAFYSYIILYEISVHNLL